MALMKEHLANTIWQLAANVANWKVSPACRRLSTDPGAGCSSGLALLEYLRTAGCVPVPQIVATLMSATRWFIVRQTYVAQRQRQRPFLMPQNAANKMESLPALTVCVPPIDL